MRQINVIYVYIKLIQMLTEALNLFIEAERRLHVSVN